jgi:hypothetical protein
MLSYQYIFSPDTICSLQGMARDKSTDFPSNDASWPLIALSTTIFKEIYFGESRR